MAFQNMYRPSNEMRGRRKVLEQQQRAETTEGRCQEAAEHSSRKVHASHVQLTTAHRADGACYWCVRNTSEGGDSDPNEGRHDHDKTGRLRDDDRMVG
ncbi:hypothetical protein L208DRAFT_1415073 [Tricholoma matsutake]|nr:hypothetical protein L208DRAFT_1415073 [Tricholoma matsutake 945]